MALRRALLLLFVSVSAGLVLSVPTLFNGSGQVAAQIADDDGDGLPNNVDQCPQLAGPRTNDGCPMIFVVTIVAPDDLAQPPEPPEPPSDSDGDGVPDNEDDCPRQHHNGAIFNGCPDSDGDGLVDNIDLCPAVAGPPEPPSQGCPDATEPEPPQAPDQPAASPQPPAAPTQPLAAIPADDGGVCLIATQGGQNVNVRADASTGAAIVGFLSPTQLYVAVGTKDDAQGQRWYLLEASFDGQPGYVASWVIRESASCASLSGPPVSIDDFASTFGNCPEVVTDARSLPVFFLNWAMAQPDPCAPTMNVLQESIFGLPPVGDELEPAVLDTLIGDCPDVLFDTVFKLALLQAFSPTAYETARNSVNLGGCDAAAQVGGAGALTPDYAPPWLIATPPILVAYPTVIIPLPTATFTPTPLGFAAPLTPTDTPTPTPLGLAGNPTATDTHTPTPTVDVTATPTETGTPMISPTPDASATATATGTPMVSPEPVTPVAGTPLPTISPTDAPEEAPSLKPVAGFDARLAVFEVQHDAPAPDTDLYLLVGDRIEPLLSDATRREANPAIDSRGLNVAYIQTNADGRSSVYVMDLTTRQARELLPSTESLLVLPFDPAWIPGEGGDTQLLVTLLDLTTNQAGVYQLNVDPSINPVPAMVVADATAPTVAPHGLYIAYLRGGQVMTLALGTGRERAVTAAAQFTDCQTPAFDADTLRLYFVCADAATSATALYRYDRGGLNVVTAVPGSALNPAPGPIEKFLLADDGTEIWFGTSDGQFAPLIAFADARRARNVSLPALSEWAGVLR